MKQDIYISASRRDFVAVSKIRAILYSANYSCFVDVQNLYLASDFEQRMRAEILSSNIFVCVLSENAYSSQYVKSELAFALKEKEPSKVFLIVVDGSKPYGKIEELTSTYRNIRLDLNEIADAKVILLHEIEKTIRIGEKDIKRNDIIERFQNYNPKIFISYKRDDKDKVFKIKNNIESQTGMPCWIDVDGIESDAQFINVIIKAINSADIFLFMYSSQHKQIEDYENDWTVREICYAQKRKKRIVFVNLDGAELTDWFEMMFGAKQHIDASSEIAMNKLFGDIRVWLN